MPDLTGEELDWRDAKRAEVIRIAAAELGSHGKGSPRVIDYWRDVLPTTKTDAQTRSYSKDADWCGGFVLFCLHRAGLAPDVKWKIGSGFALGLLPSTKDPQPGDVCIRPKNGAGKFVWHHALVESCADGRLVTIDGNQPGVLRRDRAKPTSNMDYYSIEPLLARALDAEAERLRAP